MTSPFSDNALARGSRRLIVPKRNEQRPRVAAKARTAGEPSRRHAWTDDEDRPVSYQVRDHQSAEPAMRADLRRWCAEAHLRRPPALPPRSATARRRSARRSQWRRHLVRRAPRRSSNGGLRHALTRISSRRVRVPGHGQVIPNASRIFLGSRRVAVGPLAHQAAGPSEVPVGSPGDHSPGARARPTRRCLRPPRQPE